MVRSEGSTPFALHLIILIDSVMCSFISITDYYIYLFIFVILLSNIVIMISIIIIIYTFIIK